MIDPLELVLIIEQRDPGDHSEEEIIESLSEHRETLRRLQGSWGRFIHDLEESGRI